MKSQNIENLTTLWLLASKPFGKYERSGNYNIVELDFSEWPNRVWNNTPNEKTIPHDIKDVLNQYNTNLTYSKWNDLNSDEGIEAKDLGLILKSIQIGMSLNLNNYIEQPLSHHLILKQVDNMEKASLWSEIFNQCFGYIISAKIVEALKDTVYFYLVYSGKHPVGCVATFIHDHQIGIHSLGVLAEFRKKGIAEQVMHILLQQAKNSGLVNAHLQSSMLGLGIYKKLKFVEIFKMYNYKK